ncbi:hypothetical protein [Vibrio salinus]|uniref:hypothetical protein n=1 Tax=Vibrio salinus TaxID=2899784 RepID=UPI001E4B30E1|nr:hypothetical protein [Vibrio salinus]MCE0495259.1 hypothetical protein [Vibrio salinus]
MRYFLVLIFFVMNNNVAFGANGESYFYKSASLSSVPAQPYLKNSDLWFQTVGFNWHALPNLHFNVGYLDSIHPAPHLQDQTSQSNYQGLFGAALIQRSFDKFGTVYAKGGLNWLKENNNYGIVFKDSVTSPFSELSPYLSIGASVPAPMQRNLELNVELSYQNLQLDEPDTIFTMGAKYRF